MACQLCQLPLGEFRCIIRRKVRLHEDIALRRSIGSFGTVLSSGTRPLNECTILPRVSAFHDHFDIARQCQRPFQPKVDHILRSQRHCEIAHLCYGLEAERLTLDEDIKPFLPSEEDKEVPFGSGMVELV
jgi:hypothetical protein